MTTILQLALVWPSRSVGNIASFHLIPVIGRSICQPLTKISVKPLNTKSLHKYQILQSIAIFALHNMKNGSGFIA